jgi:hypothetical protein
VRIAVRSEEVRTAAEAWRHLRWDAAPVCFDVPRGVERAAAAAGPRLAAALRALHPAADAEVQVDDLAWQEVARRLYFTAAHYEGRDQAGQATFL